MTKTAKRPGPAAPEQRGAAAASAVPVAALAEARVGASADAPGEAATSPASLAAALRERLLERLRDARVPEGHAQAVHLAGITGRAYQTTRRWIDEESPGLPDLASFRLLCEGVDGDPMWLLGLTDEKRSLREAMAPVGETSQATSQATRKGAGKGASKSSGADDAEDRWLDGVSSSVGQEMYGCIARLMRGDEMDPEIADGDTVFINTHVGEFNGNGTYLVTCDGQELIRRLEYTVGKGLVVSCANPRYEPAVFRDAPEILAHGLQVLGRIEGVVQIRKFWRRTPVGTQGR